MNFVAKLLWSGAAQSAKYNGVKALLMSADHYLFSTKFANCTSHLFSNLVLLLFWKFWIQLLLDPAFILYWFHFEAILSKYASPIFLLQLSKWKFSPRVSKRAQNLWIVEAKNFARVTFCFDKVTSSDRCAPHLLSLGITLVMGGCLRNCLFFFAHSLPNHPGPATVVCYQTKQDTRILILDDDGAGDDIEVNDTLSAHVR